jgi:hypothetical protein
MWSATVAQESIRSPARYTLTSPSKMSPPGQSKSLLSLIPSVHRSPHHRSRRWTQQQTPALRLSLAASWRYIPVQETDIKRSIGIIRSRVCEKRFIQLGTPRPRREAREKLLLTTETGPSAMKIALKYTALYSTRPHSTARLFCTLTRRT